MTTIPRWINRSNGVRDSPDGRWTALATYDIRNEIDGLVLHDNSGRVADSPHPTLFHVRHAAHEERR